MARCGHVTVLFNFFLIHVMVAGRNTSVVYVKRGDNVTLECKLQVDRMYVTWLGPPNSTFYFLGNLVPAKLTSISIEGNESNHEHFLRISDISDKYTGAYDCYAFTRPKHWYFNVILRSNPTCLTIVNATNDHAIFSFENKEVTLECRVKTGKPKGYLQWERESKVLMTRQQNTLLYTFKPKRLDNGKTYTCEALNDAMEKVLEETVSLIVYYIPKVTILGNSSKCITEGQDLHLICQHDSNDKNATLSWIRNTMPYPRHTGHSLVTRNVNRNESGNYTCVIESRGGVVSNTVHVIVQYAPNVFITVTETTTSKILHCKANGIPDKYTFDHWEHMSFLGEHIRFLNGTKEGKLSVPSTTVDSSYSYQNMGIYRCRVSNGILDINDNLYQTSSKELILAGKPFFLNESEGTQFRKHGKDVSAEVYVYSCPKYYVARLVNAKHVLKLGNDNKDHQYVLETIQTKSMAAINGRQLVIPAFKITITLQKGTESDIKDMTFVVENVYGSAHFSIDLKSTIFQKDHSKNGHSYVIVYAVLLLVVLIFIFATITFFMLTEKGKQWKSGCLRKIAGSVIDEAGAVAVENEIYGIGNNNAVATDRNTPVYSSIDRRANLNIHQTVSYAVSPKKQKSTKKCTGKKSDDNGNGNQKTATSAQASSSKETPELNYVDVCFDPKPKDYKIKIHGIENKTPYADVDFTQSIDTKLPSSDEEKDSDDDVANVEEVKKMKRSTRCT